MSSVLSDKKLKQLFQELEEVAPSVDFSQRLRRQIFRKKPRFYFAAHFLIFVVFLAVLPFSYQNVANDFIKFEILPMIGSILSSFEFSFDFISYQINFIGSFLPLNSIFFFSFNLLIFLAAAFLILKDIKNLRLADSRFFQVVAGIILIFAFCGLPAGHLVLAQAPENPSFDKTSVLPSHLEEEVSEQIVLTGVVEEVDIDMA
ncbi:MAG: hypothetical protein Q8L57_00495, partial [bacterium]|nr:hypothetical protein [bacterium]